MTVQRMMARSSIIHLFIIVYYNYYGTRSESEDNHDEQILKNT